MHEPIDVEKLKSLAEQRKAAEESLVAELFSASAACGDEGLAALERLTQEIEESARRIEQGHGDVLEKRYFLALCRGRSEEAARLEKILVRRNRVGLRVVR